MDEHAARTELLANWQTQLSAMDSGDTETLASCFTPEAVLVHMTGVRQPLDEWMAGIRRGTFVYHQVIEHDVDVQVDGEHATLVGNITTGYRPDGSGQAWPLHVVQDFRHTADGWLCTESRVTFGG